jgi:hypothetical protein
MSVPAERMKAGKGHRVPLSGRALAILGEAQRGRMPETRYRLRCIRKYAYVAIFCLEASSPLKAQTSQSFRFESYETLEDMQKFIEQRFPLGSSRDSVRRTFVNDGKATLKIHPTQEGVEKYIYDINLCSYYIWRWNISVDFDNNGRLVQAYLNGNPVLKDGRPKRDFRLKATPGKKQTIYKGQRPRPEATKGEKSLGFALYDLDSDPKTIDDQSLIGAGPSRANPINMGRMVAYEVEPWRSIFDFDNADRIVPYAGDCAEADAFHERARQAR